MRRLFHRYRQDNGFVGGVWRGFEAFGFEALESKAEAGAFPVQHLDAMTGVIEEDEKYEVRHGDFDVEFHRGSEAMQSAEPNVPRRMLNECRYHR